MRSKSVGWVRSRVAVEGDVLQVIAVKLLMRQLSTIVPCCEVKYRFVLLLVRSVFDSSYNAQGVGSMILS